MSHFVLDRESPAPNAAPRGPLVHTSHKLDVKLFWGLPLQVWDLTFNTQQQLFCDSLPSAALSVSCDRECGQVRVKPPSPCGLYWAHWSEISRSLPQSFRAGEDPDSSRQEGAESHCSSPGSDQLDSRYARAAVVTAGGSLFEARPLLPSCAVRWQEPPLCWGPNVVRAISSYSGRRVLPTADVLGLAPQDRIALGSWLSSAAQPALAAATRHEPCECPCAFLAPRFRPAKS